MIVIVGSNRDDTLYFSTVLKNKSKDTLLGRYEILTGTLFNQDILIINEQYTSVLASSVMMQILNSYYVDLVIVVGKCVSLDKRLKCGDIVISNRIIDANVNMTMYSNARLAEIPGFNRNLMIQSDLIDYLQEGLSKKSYNTAKEATFLSCDNLNPEYIKLINSSTGIFGLRDEYLVYDFNSSGVGIACALKEVPFVAIKVIEKHIDQEDDIKRYLTVLENYSDLGKAVTSIIGEIGRNDILSEEDING